MASALFYVLRCFFEPDQVGALPNKYLLPPKNITQLSGLPPIAAAAAMLKGHAHEGARPFESLCEVKGMKGRSDENLKVLFPKTLQTSKRYQW